MKIWGPKELFSLFMISLWCSPISDVVATITLSVLSPLVSNAKLFRNAFSAHLAEDVARQDSCHLRHQKSQTSALRG
jgi:hypothetical protein